jgi:hypothetical protein
MNGFTTAAFARPLPPFPVRLACERTRVLQEHRWRDNRMDELLFLEIASPLSKVDDFVFLSGYSLLFLSGSRNRWRSLSSVFSNIWINACLTSGAVIVGASLRSAVRLQPADENIKRVRRLANAGQFVGSLGSQSCINAHAFRFVIFFEATFAANRNAV